MITDKQRKNLMTLANGLLSEPREHCISVNVEFNMRVFNDQANMFGDGDYKTKCGTVGCAVGWAPYFGLRKKRNESWLEFSQRMLIDSNINIAEWQWCFAGGWQHVDNTRQGAAKRIIWLLQYGLPHNWERQLEGRDELCYTEIENFCDSYLEEHA